MGIDFTAILDHSLSWDELYGLPERLNLAFVAPPQVLAVHPKLVSDNIWSWNRDRRYSNVAEELFEEGHLFLDGPAGFSATVFRTAIELHHLARWWSFVFESGVRSGLIAAALAVARLARGSTIIYAPDSSVPTARGSEFLFEGASFEEVLRWFGESIGSPVATFEDLAALEDATNELGYVIQLVAG